MLPCLPCLIMVFPGHPLGDAEKCLVHCCAQQCTRGYDMAMSRYGRMVATIKEDTHDMWVQFRREVRKRDLSITAALTQAARLWLLDLHQTGHDISPGPVSGDRLFIQGDKTAAVPFSRQSQPPAPEPAQVIKDTHVPPLVNPFK